MRLGYASFMTRSAVVQSTDNTVSPNGADAFLEHESFTSSDVPLGGTSRRAISGFVAIAAPFL